MVEADYGAFMFGRLLFLTFLVVPLIEIGIFILVGQAIGVIPTLLGVLVTAIAGSLLIRWQGMATVRNIQDTLGRGVLPARQIADAVLIGLAGLLLLLPGYFSDLIGILLLIPPVRHAIYALLVRRFGVVPARTAPRPAEPGVIDLDDQSWRDR
jgi:UPF0716 protein FxsA